jgi:hypothetical protein
MRTFLFMGALGILGVVMKYVASFILDVLTVPGKPVIRPDRSGKCSESRLRVAISIAAFLQSYVYLVYVAFVVRWTLSAMEDQGVSSISLFAAIFAVFFPVGSRLRDARKDLGEVERVYRREYAEDFENKANERERTIALSSRSLSITFVLTLVASVVFFYFPESTVFLYGRTFEILGDLLERCHVGWPGSSGAV